MFFYFRSCFFKALLTPSPLHFDWLAVLSGCEQLCLCGHADPIQWSVYGLWYLYVGSRNDPLKESTEFSFLCDVFYIH